MADFDLEVADLDFLPDFLPDFAARPGDLLFVRAPLFFFVG